MVAELNRQNSLRGSIGEVASRDPVLLDLVGQAADR
jgi:hypothetical protein